MSDTKRQVIHYEPVLGPEERERRMLEKYRERRSAMAPKPRAERPERRPPDETTWMGGKRNSSRLRRHEEQVDDTDYAGEEQAYAIARGIELSVGAVEDAADGYSAQMAVFRKLPPDSYEADATEELILDARDEIRNLVKDATESYRRRAIR